MFLAGLAILTVFAGLHLSQGTSDVTVADMWAWLTGGGEESAGAVVVGSRIPRLAAGLLVGVALGASGAALQSATRNILASPDTLAVEAGAYLAVVAVAALGLSLPVLPIGGVAFVGGLAAAALVIGVSAGGGGSPTRLVLAGSAIALALSSLTIVLMLLFSQETVGLFAWGNGSLSQLGIGPAAQVAPVVAAAVLFLLCLARPLDLLALGDDAAAVLGVRVRLIRVLTVVAAVLLAAAAVTVTGPIGFVGLCAPALVRLLAGVVRGLHRHLVLIPAAALMGAILVIGSDVLLRALLGAQAGIEVPTGVITTIIGAVFLVVLARRIRDSDTMARPPAASAARLRTRGWFVAVLATCVALLAVASVAAVLLGDHKLLLGDVANRVSGQAGPIVTSVTDARLPRVLAALAAGAALALAGAVVQAVCRNPLAEPGIIGVTGGAGVGAVLMISVLPAAGTWAIAGAAGAGGVLAAALVFGLAWRGGLGSERLVLIGVGVSAGAAALVTAIIVLTDPWNTAKALTWLSGSTYGRTMPELVPVTVALLIAAPILAGARRDLDVLALDRDTPRLLGIRVDRRQLQLLAVAVLLTTCSVAAIGVIAFVGLVAPHAARALVGARHSRVLPVAALLGAILVSVADTVGRTVIAPDQLPAGVMTAIIGAPYFVYLLWRTRS